MTQQAINAAPVVFVVDDDIDVRKGLKSLMGSVGLRCEVFASALEFMRREAADTVNCLILDVRLPGMNGLDFQAKLAVMHADIPIIFITGYGDIPTTVKAMKTGAVDFLTKPVREQDLLDAVHVALERDRIRQEQTSKLNHLRVRYESLSSRHRKLLSLVTAGLLNKQIAGEMNLSETTVKVQRRILMQKLGAESLVDLTQMAGVLGVGESHLRGTKH